MEKDTEKTPVIFRKWNDGEVIALFPTIPGAVNNPGSCQSYLHIGQHGNADYDGVIYNTKPANKEEYQDLFEELEDIGYNLKVCQKCTRAMIEERIRELYR